MQAQGWLDLADGALARADLAAGAAHLASAEPFAGVEHAFRWRHLLRRRLLDARLRLLGGDPAAAEELLAGLEAEAAERGVRRYLLQARLLRARARAARGAAVDRDALAPELEALATTAGLDGWRFAAAVAAALDAPEWRDAARRLGAAVAANAGERRGGFELPYASTLIESASIRAT